MNVIEKQRRRKETSTGTFRDNRSRSFARQRPNTTSCFPADSSAATFSLRCKPTGANLYLISAEHFLFCNVSGSEVNTIFLAIFINVNFLRKSLDVTACFFNLITFFMNKTLNFE